MKEDISKCSNEQSVLLNVRIDNLEKQVESINSRLNMAFSVAGYLFPDRERKVKEQEEQSSRDPEIQSSRDPEIQSSRDPEIQSSRDPEIQSSRDPEIQSSRDPEIQSSSSSSGKEVVAKTSPKGFSKGSSQRSKFIKLH